MQPSTSFASPQSSVIISAAEIVGKPARAPESQTGIAQSVSRKSRDNKPAIPTQCDVCGGQGDTNCIVRYVIIWYGLALYSSNYFHKQILVGISGVVVCRCCGDLLQRGIVAD